MNRLYPLIFAPVFKDRVWGGRKLARWFDELPEGPVGEAWVLSDHPHGRTPVQNGPLAGETLTTLRQRFGAAIFGTGLQEGAFPLLFKLLDCQDDLSIQVHPDDTYHALQPGELGKTEMWVVLEAEPGAQVVYGLKEGVTAERFARAIAEGRTMEVMRTLPVQAGDVLYVPAGTVHALGRGLLVAEIQQSSDTTYRIYDYDRPGLDGKPRELHVDHALAVTRYLEVPEPLRLAPPEPNRWQEIARSPYFIVHRAQCQGEWSLAPSADSFQALMILAGEGQLDWDGGSLLVRSGHTILLPASLERCRLTGSLHLLLTSLPM